MLEFYAHRKKMIKAQLQWIITGDNKYLEDLEKVRGYFVNLDHPKDLDAESSTNYIVKARKEFQQLCVTLMVSGIKDPENLSVFQFMETVHHHEKHKPNSNQHSTNLPRRPSIRARRKN